jgi:hypothetical protein
MDLGNTEFDELLKRKKERKGKKPSWSGLRSKRGVELQVFEGG